MSCRTERMPTLRIMIAVIACFLCFLSTAAGQEDEYASRIKISIIPNDPFLKLYAKWDPKPNMGQWTDYEVSICQGEFSCSTYSVGRGQTEFTFGSVRSVKLAYWSQYTVTVKISGMWTVDLWAKRTIATGPGFLPSALDFRVRGGLKSITAEWRGFSENMRKVIDFYKIVICHHRVNICSPPEKALPGATNHTFNGLTAGVEYNVTLTLHKSFEGHDYMSLPVTKTGFTEPPPRNLYPGLRDVKVDLQRNKLDCDFVITYTEPAVPAGKKFYGVLIEIFDFRGKRIIESTKTSSKQVIVKGMPFFSRFQVRVHAVYQEGDDLIETDSDRIAVQTGIGDIAKPEIVKLLAVNGSSAAVRWTHEASEHSEYIYRLTFKDGPTIEVQDTENDFVLVQNLEAEREYIVTLTAVRKEDSHEYASPSDEKLVKMLPKNALIPEVEVGTFVGDQLLLNCKVILPPEESDACSLEVSACLANSDVCSNTTFESAASDSMWIYIAPFMHYELVVRTECVFFDRLSVAAQSESLTVFNKIHLSPVEDIYTISTDTTIGVEWTVLPSQELFCDGFKIRWAPVGSDLGPEHDGFLYEFDIEGLQPATEYNISITAYSIHENETLLGETAFTTASTEVPAPAAVDGLDFQQVSYSSTIKVTWNAPAYEYAPLEYTVVSKCLSEKTSSTSGTSHEFNFDGLKEGDAECTVSVTTRARNRENQLIGTNVASKTKNIEKLMPKPQGCSAVFVGGIEYNVTITAPPGVRDLDVLEYRISDSLDRDGKRTKDSSIVIESSKHDTVDTRRAQLCANDICGDDFLCKVETNTGNPGSVNDLQVVLLKETTLHVTWSEPSLTNGPINGYIVRIQNDLSGAVKNVQRNASETSFDYPSGEEYTKFTVAVRAFNYDKFVTKADPLVGPEEYGSIETMGTVPRAPEALDVVYIEGKQTLIWNATVDPKFNVKSYKIVANEKSATNRSEISSKSPELQLSALKPFTEYVIEVSSCLDEGSKQCGKPSTHELTTEVGHPSSPTPLLVDRNATHILVRWSMPFEKAGPIDGFEFAYVESSISQSPSNWMEISGEARSVALQDLQPSTEYVVHVRAFNEDHFGNKLKSSVGILTADTQGVSKGLAAPWIAVLCCLAVGTLLALGFVAVKKFKPHLDIDLQRLISTESREEPQSRSSAQES